MIMETFETKILLDVAKDLRITKERIEGINDEGLENSMLKLSAKKINQAIELIKSELF